MKRAHGGHIVDEEPKVKAVLVCVCVVLPTLEHQGEAVAVREDREGRGGAVRFEVESEQILEEPHGTGYVGNLQVEVIELHG
jgi:hypothetical protein